MKGTSSRQLCLLRRCLCTASLTSLGQSGHCLETSVLSRESAARVISLAWPCLCPWSSPVRSCQGWAEQGCSGERPMRRRCPTVSSCNCNFPLPHSALSHFSTKQNEWLIYVRASNVFPGSWTAFLQNFSGCSGVGSATEYANQGGTGSLSPFLLSSVAFFLSFSHSYNISVFYADQMANSFSALLGLSRHFCQCIQKLSNVSEFFCLFGVLIWRE